jgi:hypothetical protein
LQVRFLHEPDVTYGMQYGIDLDAFTKQIDPTKQFRVMQQLNITGVVAPKDAKTNNFMSLRQKRALIAAAHLSKSLPRQMDATLSLEELTSRKLLPDDLAQLTRTRSVYFSTKDDLPIVIDTGGSFSVTPNVDDFEGNLRPADIDDLQGLSASAVVAGVGIVKWNIKDVFGSTRTIRTQSYYVPEAAIRLFSPQSYFQEQDAGELWCNAKRSVLTLADGSQLEFPYNPGSNLPLMLPDRTKTPVGFTFEDKATFTALGDRAFMSVADESNQNITASQKELLKWHWKLGHANFNWIQRLAAHSKLAPDGMSLPILRTKTPSVSSCPAPLCSACQMAKQSRRNPEVKVGIPVPEKEMSLRRGKLLPGEMVSIDQYESTLPGRLPHTKGKEPKKDKYNGGTLFVDHATAYIYLRHQVSLRVGDTLQTKHAFERFAAEHGVKIHAYRADNAPFGAKQFTDDLDARNQRITYSGTGAHHQNGVAERAIQTVTSWARAMLLHAVLHWPDQADLSLWPFALEYAVYLWNNIPRKDSLLAPLELFASSKFDSYDHLHRAHVWGYPVYVLDPKLQDGKKLPKWSARCRRGRYLGPSPDHSSTIGRILNLVTGSVSPQFHCVYDDWYTTVPNAETGGILDLDQFRAESWAKLVESGSERSNEEPDYDSQGRRLPQLELHDEWLTPAERRLREQSRQARRHRQFPPRPPDVHSVPLTAPEGEDDDDAVESAIGTVPSPAPPVVHLPGVQPQLDTDAIVETTVDDDERSLTSLPEGVTEDDIPVLSQDVNDDEIPTESTDPGRRSPERLGRGHRTKKRNPKIWDGDHEVDLPYRAPRGALNRQFLNSLNWKLALNAIRSNDLKGMMTEMELHTDPDDRTLDWMSPMIFGAKANSEDTPTWEQAMNGPDRDGYMEACQKEINTLVNDKDAWDVVAREPWMNVLPSTWAFKCKRYPDGTVRKLKSRFCVRGDKQVEGVDFFDTFAPVVNWTTVRLMLILSIVLGLSTRQVDYTAAFVHAPIDKDPDWDSLTPTEQERRGIYVEMPRGFSEPGKVLKLKRLLYGLKQSPRNFFQFLKGKLEGIGFTSATDVDPCLFVSDKVICLVYVDDTLFYSPKPEYIDEVIQKLRDAEMDLEEEGSVAGFLGVHIERNEKDGSIKLTQKGLIKRIIETLNIQHLPIKHTPAAAEPLVLDADGDPPNATYSYPSVVGMLQYLQAHSRPDITFAVSQCARFTHRTRRSHEVAVERIGQYLKATQDEGLILQPTGLFDIECYVDADFAGLWPYEDKHDPSCVKSRTGFVICISGCPVIWSSKLQTDIATSTMEAEYNGLSMSMRDLLPFKRLFLAVSSGIGLGHDVCTAFKTTVWEDNNGALSLANMEPGRMTPRSKHYAVKYHWFRSHLSPNSVEVKKIDTNLQKADIFTKGLRIEKFRAIRKLLCGW